LQSNTAPRKLPETSQARRARSSGLRNSGGPTRGGLICALEFQPEVTGPTLKVSELPEPQGTSRWISPATTSRGYCSFRHCFTLFTEFFAPFDHSTSALSVPVAILRLSGNPPARDSCCTIKQHYSKGATGAGGRGTVGSASRTVTGLVTLFHLHHSRFQKIVGPEVPRPCPAVHSPTSHNAV
jgi:hypothetical protein